MHPSPRPVVRLAILITAVLLIRSPLPASAQQRGGGAADSLRLRALEESLLGTGVSHADVVVRLQRSGMTRSQMRAGLQRMGYDPGLADRYFDVIEGRRAIVEGDADRSFLEALAALGVPAVTHADELTLRSPWADSLHADSRFADSRFADSTYADSLLADSLRRSASTVFGLELFRRFTTQFDAPLGGPVDPGYRLGPGDELSLIMTGEVEASYGMEVTREGFIVIPDVGQVVVVGLTMEELEERLRDRLARHYAGIGGGADAPIRFHVGLGRLRTSLVYVVGEAVRPGAYQVSSVGTVLNALYLAGGPGEQASFRRVEVRRGGELTNTLDLYDYLIAGDTRDDVRLDHGDVVFLPPSGPHVTIEGAVRRPAIYEALPGEQLTDLLAFAGGLSSDAASHRVQIDRILPPAERPPGIDRVLMDVDLSAPRSGESVEVRDGDVVRVFEVRPERRMRIVLTGEVNRPGIYEWRDGLTLGALFERAEGLGDQAYVARTQVFRWNPADGSRTLVRVDARDVVATRLEDRDSIVVYSRADLATPRFVSIDGFVKQPGTYELAAGMSVQDLVLAAGGFVHGAWTIEAELARLPSTRTDANDDGSTVRVRLGGRPDSASAGVIAWTPDAGEVKLEHGDRVYIRKAPEYEGPRSVTIVGEVIFPGAYALTQPVTRISDVLKRTGGPKPEAYLSGAQLVRDGHLVATDLGRAFAMPGGPHDLEIMAGDSITVPRLDATVLVRGAVGFETRVRHEPGRSVDYYIDRAGGLTDAADHGRTTVTELNGERRLVRIRTLFFDSKPEPGPGATVFVPAKPPSAGGFNWDALLTRILAVATATATVMIALDRTR